MAAAKYLFPTTESQAMTTQPQQHHSDMTTRPRPLLVSQGRFTIRPVAQADIAQLFALLEQKAAFDGCPDALRATEGTVSAALFSPAPPMHALVADIDGKLVGMATYHAIFSTFLMRPGLWLDDLFVHESQRGRGIGRALIGQVACIAQQRGCARVDWLVDSANDNGKQFYRSMGAAVSEQLLFCRLNEDVISVLTTRHADPY